MTHSNDRISTAEMRKLLTETDLPSEIAKANTSLAAMLPPKPPIPKGVPQDWQEALFTPGICAIPLWSTNRWRFGAICDGMPITDGRDGSMVMFDTYDEAIRRLKGWYRWKSQQQAKAK